MVNCRIQNSLPYMTWQNVPETSITFCQLFQYCVRMQPSNTYHILFHYSNYVLGRSEGMHEMGPIRWQLCLCLLLAWIVVFLCIIKGVKSSGKVREKHSNYILYLIPRMVVLEVRQSIVVNYCRSSHDFAFSHSVTHKQLERSKFYGG